MVLLVSWLACGASIRVFGIHGRCAGLAMGAVAFALLMAAELAVPHSPLADRQSNFYERMLAGSVGLEGQIAFGFIPLLQSGEYRKADQDLPFADH